MITNDLTAAITALQYAFEDEDRKVDAKDALDDLNRAMHLLVNSAPDSPLIPVVTATLELGYTMLD